MSALRKWAVVGTVAAVSGIGIGTAAYAAPAGVELNDHAKVQSTTTADDASASQAAPAASSADTPGETASTNTPNQAASADTPGDTSSANTPGDTSADSTDSPR